MPPGQSCNSRCEHAPRRPGTSWIARDVRPACPGACSCSNIYICPIKEGLIFVDRKIARPALGSLRAVERLAKTPKRRAERAVSGQTADQRIGGGALAGRSLP